MIKLQASRHVRDHLRGFTFVELLCVVAMAALLVTAAVPVWSHTRPDTRAIQCLSNMRVLIGVWQMYAQDNNDKLVPALEGTLPLGVGLAWVGGWLDWTRRSDNTNISYLIDPRYAAFGDYLHDPRTYKCPSDPYLSAMQIAAGWTARVRSYSGNITIGPDYEEAGPWNGLYSHIVKMTDFRYPPPAQAWVFVTEHPDSIDDSAFSVPLRPSWVSLPAPFHNGATPFAFADGHADMHKWQGSLTSNRPSQVAGSDGVSGAVVQPGDPDLHWISEHSPQVSRIPY